MDPLAGLIGDSPGVVALREQVVRLLARLARMPRWPSLLVLGETGVGKGHLVRALHQGGPRRRGPFVDLNCAAIPETLLESELFGFARGAFTDARHDKPGLCQAATGGLLFLDEIGALPVTLQAKLLKAIDERQVRRLGSTRQEPFDAWIVSATGEELERLVTEGRFRADLYHRLSAVTLRVPPLRERDGDVVLLAEHFLARIASEHGLEPRRLADDARAALTAYSWPGNVRELSNRLERMALLADDALVTAAALDLPRPSEERRPTRRHPPRALEGAIVLAALRDTAWNISRAAARLGVPRNTLRYQIRKLGLVRESGAGEGDGRSRGTVDSRAGLRSPLRWEHRSVALLRAVLVPAPGQSPTQLAPTIDQLIDQVASRGGRTEEITPSGIVAAFGPEGVEDGPRRAVEAALAMRQTVAPQSSAGVIGLVSIGIHVAPCLVALGGEPMGMAPADRRAAWTTLEELTAYAGPLGIALSEPAARLVERRIALRRMEGGVGSRDAVYCLVRSGSTFTGTTLRGQSPFVGRARELSVLQGLVERAAAGQGQVVGLVGEPGIGKSRLLHELRTRIVGTETEWLEGHCVSYGGSTPYLPVLDLLRARSGAVDTDSPHAILERARPVLEETGADGLEGLPYLAALLGLDPGPAWPDGVSAEIVKARTFDVLERVLTGTGRARVVVIAVEDVHWRDPTSEEFFATLADSLAARRVLFVASYRPGSHPPWLDRSYATQVALPALDREASVVLARAALGGGPDETLVSAIVGRAEGNPFFLEELAVSVRRDAVSSADAVPATVEAVLRARIDRLRPRERAVLQSLAAISRQAPASLIAAVSALDQDAALAALRGLHAAELLVQERPGPEAPRGLRHALTRDVAYASLLPDECRVLHGRIVTAIETLHAGRLAPELERLADHAMRAELWGKAVDYSREAGREAAARAAHREAVAWLEHALAALAHLPDGRKTAEATIDCRLALHDSFVALNEKARSLAELRRAEGLAIALHDEPRLVRTLSGLTVTLRLRGDFAPAIETGQRALTIAAARREPWLGIGAGFHVGQAYAMLGEHRQAIRYFEESARAAEEAVLAQLSAREPLPHLADRVRRLGSIDSRGYLAISLAELGEFAGAMAAGESALTLAQAIDDPIALLATLRGLGYVHLRRGDAGRAISVLQRAMDVIETKRIPLFFTGTAGFLGAALTLAGRVEEAFPLLAEALARGEGSRARTLVFLGEAQLAGGRVEDAGRAGREALDFARARGLRGFEAYALRLLGDVAARSGPWGEGEAAALFEGVIALGGRLGMRPLVAHAHLGLGRLGMRTRIENLEKAARLFGEMDTPFWRDVTERELAGTV
jgi:transcriptional regulator with AAA-type ATPase domain/tetratricopeptide (TPR) repeat protein